MAFRHFRVNWTYPRSVALWRLVLKDMAEALGLAFVVQEKQVSSLVLKDMAEACDYLTALLCRIEPKTIQRLMCRGSAWPRVFLGPIGVILPLCQCFKDLCSMGDQWTRDGGPVGSPAVWGWCGGQSTIP